jgi:ABC-type uncharacterized transport system involved in gliding motility auxiliary subunit
MADTTKQRSASLWRRRLLIRFNVLAQIAAVALLVCMVNWLVARHYFRVDWTRTGYYKLSEKTKQALATLKSPLQVVVFLPKGDQRDYIEKTLQDVRNLLKEFEFYGKDKLRVEYVDAYRNLARARQLVHQYKLDSPNVVIFASGDRHKYVTLDEMVEIEQMGYMAPPRVKAFKGEGAFLSAIQTIIEEEPPKVYFLTGHGERDPDDHDEPDGYSRVAGYIKRDNIVVHKWNLLEKQTLPADAGALIVAGPRTAFNETELHLLEAYLAKRGRLLLMLDPRYDANLQPLLKQWGVQADDDLVVSPLLGMINVTALGTEYAPHPVTKKLDGVNTSFPYARSIRRVPRPQGVSTALPNTIELVKTPTEAGFWGETDPDAQRVTFDAATDLPGPLPLAVAAEQGRTSEASLDIGISRLVVVGTSSFVDNHGLTGGNIDFFMSALNWLLQREQLAAVGPKTPEEFRLDMTPAQSRAVYVLAIAGLPLGVAGLGVVVWARRRK